MTSDDYCVIIVHVTLPYVLDGPFPGGDFVLQHDQPPVHTSRQVRSLLEERCVATLPWPPKGADLNIVAHVWGRTKSTMARCPLHRATSDELWEEVSREWVQLRGEPDFVTALYGSLPNRTRAVVAELKSRHRALVEPEKTKTATTNRLAQLVYKIQGPQERSMDQLAARYLYLDPPAVQPDYEGSENPQLDGLIS
ncbi:putative transposable element tc1 transposase [Ixodes scapularis]